MSTITQKENVALSVNDRLKAVARKAGGDTNVALQFIQARYVYERLLARLQRTAFSDRWVLKGGVLMLTLETAVNRMTMDMDWSVTKGENLSVGACLRELCAMQAEPEDGVSYELVIEGKDALRVIREEAELPTVRGKLVATLHCPRPSEKRFVVDITGAELGFTPVRRRWEPTIRGFEPFDVSACPWELVVAEKLHSVMTADSTTPRLRDFMDVIALAREDAFDHQQASAWIARVFEVRGNTEPNLDGKALTTDFAVRRQADWSGTLGRTGYAGSLPESFADAIGEVRSIAGALLSEKVAAPKR